LTAEARRVLNARITAVQARTGGDIGVAIVTDLRGYAPVDAGVAIYRAWKIGKVDSLGSARRDLGRSSSSSRRSWRRTAAASAGSPPGSGRKAR
jgi:hypothetical protein